MGREVRMVPANWEHPKQGGTNSDGSPRYIALFDGSSYASRVENYDNDKAKWDRGEFPEYASEENKKMKFEEWDGDRPDPENYMPQWKPEERTHLMMYETCSEGTPISPAFETPEQLARWLADNNASAFGSMTATYDQWLRMAQEGWAPSAIMSNGEITSGVAGLT